MAVAGGISRKAISTNSHYLLSHFPLVNSTLCDANDARGRNFFGARLFVRTSTRKSMHRITSMMLRWGISQGMAVAWNSEKLLAEAPQSSAQYAVENRYKKHM